MNAFTEILILMLSNSRDRERKSEQAYSFSFWKIQVGPFGSKTNLFIPRLPEQQVYYVPGDLRHYFTTETAAYGNTI